GRRGSRIGRGGRGGHGKKNKTWWWLLSSGLGTSQRCLAGRGAAMVSGFYRRGWLPFSQRFASHQLVVVPVSTGLRVRPCQMDQGLVCAPRRRCRGLCRRPFRSWSDAAGVTRSAAVFLYGPGFG